MNLLTIQSALEATDVIRVLNPAHGPDPAPSALDLFGNLKEKLRSGVVTDRNSLVSVMTEIFNDTPQDEFIIVYQNWMK